MVDDNIKIKASKPISELKKGDKLKVDGKEFEVDAHVVLVEHDKDTKEMAVEFFDKKADKDYQFRYFSNNLDNSLEVYELQNEIMYTKMDGIKKVEW